MINLQTELTPMDRVNKFIGAVVRPQTYYEMESLMRCFQDQRILADDPHLLEPEVKKLSEFMSHVRARLDYGGRPI